MSLATSVIPLPEARDIALVGGKAVNLAKMIQAGLPVPGGFVVSTAAFKSAGGADGDIPSHIAEEIRIAYRAMGSPRVAARSSATAEDMADASMAGQYETFLNLDGDDALLEAIKGCWRSMKSERLLAYLENHGIAPERVAMAVVVQRLVPADAAGVLFTADVHTGSTDVMCIEAAWGLGEGVVSGAVSPDRIRVCEQDGGVLSYEVSEKTKYLPAGGRGFEEVPSDKRSKACLNHNAILGLWKLSRQVVRFFDGPQDIEWAIADGQLFLLQSRPITTLRETALRHGLPDAIRQRLRKQLGEGRGPWVKHNLSETLPHPSPLTWSLIRSFMSGDGGYGKMHEELGFQPSATVRSEGFLENIGGRIYMDCARMPGMFAEDFPFAYDVEKLKSDPDAAQQAPTLAKGGVRERIKAAAISAAVTGKLRTLAGNLDREFDAEFIPSVKHWCGEEAKLDLTLLNDVELLERWQERCRKVFDDFGAKAFLPSMIEGLAIADLHEFLKDHAWDQSPDGLLHQLVVAGAPDMTMASNVMLQQVGKGEQSLSTWLAEYGARGPGEFDLASPRWFERAEDAQVMAERLAGGECLTKTQDLRKAAAKAAFDTLAAKLGPGLQAELREKVDLASRYVRFREDGKGYLMLAFASLRQAALEIGRRIGANDEVFLLEESEMLEALRGGYLPKDRIEYRKVMRNAEAGISLPRVLDEEALESLGTPQVADDAPHWQAHSISSGSCSGPVRIVHSPEAAGDLGEGYILVCPSTDPSWTPLFVRAAGLVLESGGALSHGAIVARELGLPALVMERATSIFRDGDILTLDAGHGVIFRGAEASTQDAHHHEVPYELRPPLVGVRERRSAKLGLLWAAGWALVLLAFYVLPASWFQDHVIALLDRILWPMVPRIGMQGTVAVIAVFFGILPLVLQKCLTDNQRLLTARDRAATLRRLSKDLPKDSPAKLEMERLASPVTMRVLKAAMTSLAFVLGPMMLIFLWLPKRFDPASWNSRPGQTLSVLAEVSGEWRKPISLNFPAALSLDSPGKETKTLPAIREALESLRQEWSKPSDLSAQPWELKATAEQVHSAMQDSLNRFLASEIPVQKISWRIRVPEGAVGHHAVRIETDHEAPAVLTLAFGNAAPPTPTEVFFESGPIRSLKAVYPRSLTKNHFWAPIPKEKGEPYDFGWLGVYLLAYLPTMVVFKKLLKVA